MIVKAKTALVKKTQTQSFYDRIAEVHNFALKINGYRASVAKFLRSLEGWTRLNRIERVTLRLSESDAGRSRAPGGQRVSCTMAISTFYLPRREAGSVAIAASDVKQAGPALP